MILDELREIISEKLREDFRIAGACVSLCYTGVMLESGHVGLCYTPIEDIARDQLTGRRNLHGSKVSEVLQTANSFNMIERATGIATLNALSQYLMEREGYEREIGIDIFDAIEVEKEDRIAVVGYMEPLVEKLRTKTDRVQVFERNLQLRGDALPDTFVDQILPKANIVILSGSSLVNGTVDRLLELSKNARVVVIAGPTASALPEPFFKRGVGVMAGVCAKGSAVLNAVAEAKSFMEFKTLVKKYVIRR
jgi:hypothetical protein